MELVQKQVRYMQEKPSITDQFQMDEDYNVPDTKDDVKQIVRSKETVKIEDINLIENYLRVSGKLCFQILYIVDSEENRLASLEGKIPFEEMVYVTDMGKDEFFIKHVRTEFQSALIHSRKISLHAMIELEIGREQMQEEETTIDMESDVPVYKKVNRINLLGIQMNKNDTYRVKEEITLPGTKESIGQLLLSDISLRKLEIRLMQDELRLQGEFLVFIIYLSEEQKMDWLEQTVLFEGKLECSGIEEGMYDYISYALEDTLADVRLDEDGEMRVIGIEGTIHLRMNIYKEESIDVLADMYSLQKKCEFEVREADYEELMIQNHSKCKISEHLNLPELKEDVLQICHSDGEIQLEHVEPSKQGLQLDGILHLFFLYLRANDEQPFGNWQGMIPFTWLLECNNMPENVKYNIAEHVEQLSVNLAGNEEVEIKAVLSFDTFIRKSVTAQVITSVAFAPLSVEEIEKRPGIVGYVVKKEDKLWDLAKKFMTTEEGIMEVNNLEQTTIKEGDKILIFKENLSIL